MNEALREQAKKQAAICSLFGNARRILILWTLAECEKPVSEIAEVIESSMQNTSQHLRLMRERGILETRRDGQSIYYRVAESELRKRCKFILDAGDSAESST